MKISQLYSNQNHYFDPIRFNSGLNVVLAEIRLPQNRTKSSHNLGKSTLARVIDFCLLGKCDKNHFFKKRPDLFEDFIFFLEVELLSGQFLTIRRSVKAVSKISFKLSDDSEADLTNMKDEDWTHFELAMAKAQGLLDGYLNFNDISPWKFRNTIGYFLRRQSDYDDVFKLQRHLGSDGNWKPVLAKILGLDAELFKNRYDLKTEIEQKSAEMALAENQAGTPIDQLEKIDGLIQLRQLEAKQKQAELDNFNFEKVDAAKTEVVVDKIDQKISELNERRYALTYNSRQVSASLKEDTVSFDPDKAKKLFDEVGVHFPDKVKIDFDKLIAFNKAITDERRQYLKEELAASKVELGNISRKLSGLNKDRSETLAFLKSEDIFTKYKELSAEISKVNADVAVLKKQQDVLNNIQGKREELRRLHAENSDLRSLAERHVRSVSQDPESLLATTRAYFSSIIEQVLGRKVLLTVNINSQGNLDFKADFVDGNELSTSEGDGTSYRKLMCVAFDLAVLRAHIEGDFPKFVFHDGIFEVLDPRPKQNLMEVIREYSDLGIQSIITLIDSDAPPPTSIGGPPFENGEVIISLHDDGDKGRLFSFESW